MSKPKDLDGRNLESLPSGASIAPDITVNSTDTEAPTTEVSTETVEKEAKEVPLVDLSDSQEVSGGVAPTAEDIAPEVRELKPEPEPVAKLEDAKKDTPVAVEAPPVNEVPALKTQEVAKSDTPNVETVEKK